MFNTTATVRFPERGALHTLCKLLTFLRYEANTLFSLMPPDNPAKADFDPGTRLPSENHFIQPCQTGPHYCILYNYLKGFYVRFHP